jgi:hypothetical protein
MCSPLKDHCRNCDKGYNFTKLQSVQSLSYAQRRNMEKMLISDRRCCSMCEQIRTADDGTPVTTFNDKEAGFKDGTYSHNPCSDCGLYNHCAEQLKKGYTNGF